MIVMKFGGSSVANGERIKSVVNIIKKKQKTDKVTVISSAMKGTTDLLIKSASLAEAGDKHYLDSYKEIEEKHFTAINELFTGESKENIRESISNMLKEISQILHGIELVKECSVRSMDLIMSFGERLSCTLIAAYLNSVGMEAEFIDTRKLIKTNNNFGNASVHFDESYENIARVIPSVKGIAIVTGFIASTENGITTTLGRNGSDYTASIIGAGASAACIEIWTDVDGVMSTDPRAVEGAFVINELSYEEAMELSYFGAEVIHPYTMIPAVDKDIPIWIKNTMNPGARGTLIAKEIKRHPSFITGIACIDNVSVVNVEGSGMMKNPDIPAKIFTILAEAGINVIMISQASSEHSICMVFKKKDASQATALLNDTLKGDIRTKRIQRIDERKEMVVIAVIGENMRGTPGISGKLFSAMGKENINIFAIAQGSSERNISFVTEEKTKIKALGVLHKVFLEENARGQQGA